MTTCCKCHRQKERREMGGMIDGLPVCIACLIAVKVEPVRKVDEPKRIHSVNRAVRVWFRGESMTFSSMAAAAKWVGCSDFTIRRVADGRVATSAAFEGRRAFLRVKYIVGKA